jgi:thioester reductase-like protein
MVGREVLRRAAADPYYRRVLCLVRGPEAQTRLDDLMRDCEIDAVGVVAVQGDVTEPGLGVDPELLREVTDVIHCAATVSFDLPLEQARHINVTGTSNVLDVCRSMPDLRRLDAVSTCYVAGRREWA